MVLSTVLHILPDHSPSALWQIGNGFVSFYRQLLTWGKASKNTHTRVWGATACGFSSLDLPWLISFLPPSSLLGFGSFCLFLTIVHLLFINCSSVVPFIRCSVFSLFCSSVFQPFYTSPPSIIHQLSKKWLRITTESTSKLISLPRSWTSIASLSLTFDSHLFSCSVVHMFSYLQLFIRLPSIFLSSAVVLWSFVLSLGFRPQFSEPLFISRSLFPYSCSFVNQRRQATLNGEIALTV